MLEFWPIEIKDTEDYLSKNYQIACHVGGKGGSFAPMGFTTTLATKCPVLGERYMS